ncbi:SpaA isopeptide-forming pilin-related protein [Blautia massiliensis (ex Durand et al. 2017)]|uniref:SpaA isopeptide-forming pilin-related protein n=1 Tax=Blautia massiliensis (ex Durand et al. 2017) TaxID=1737424 RepID=UPI00241D589D|nr:SpaA isopeptide-forming pilin-related protein [Blautia massiliensis (ex Durand et al. 2017)]MBN2955979.1 VWA domain-containing protein [Blautia massiliensis (ex Durand et al. 2017)]
MKKLRNNKIRKLLAFMVALALMVSCMPSAYTISASEAFGDGTEDIFTDGEITSEPAAEESTPDVSSADQEETEQAQQSTLTYENDSVKVTAEALEDGALPQNTALKADSVNENSSVSYDTVSQKLSAAATDKGSSLRGFFAYDVYFADGDGNRVEPNGRVRVTFEYKTPAAPELTDAASTSVTVEKLHYNNSTGDTDVNTLQANEDLKVLNVNEGKQIQTLQVETGNAAVFAVMWDSPETADVEAEAVSGNEDEVPIASEELTDGMDISDEPEQDAAETPAAENPEVTPDAEPSEAPAENPDAEPTEAPAEDPDVVEEPAEDIASPDEVPAADENGETSLIEVLGDDTNLRVSPSTEAEVLATVNAGTQLTLLDTVTAEDGATWYKVSWEGTEAYIRSDMAQVVDSSDETEEPEDVQEEEIQPEITRYDYTSDEVNVKVTLTDPADLPDNAELSVTPVELSQEAEDQITEEAIKEKKAIEKIHAYDIKFLVDGEEVQPGASVKVSVSLNDEKKIKDADVYHVDENDNVENMDGSVAKNGDVEFETTHFSTYVIVQQGNGTINVKVKYCNKDGEKEIYAEDVKSLKIGEKLKLKELANWKVTKVVVDTKSGNHREYPSDNTDVEKSIDLAENATVTAYYEATTGTTIGKPIFFDYTVKVLTKNGGRDSINNPENYSDPKSDKKLTVGGYDASNGSAIDNYDDYTYKWWDNGQCPNSWSGKWAINKDGNKDGRVTVKGLLKNVDGPNVTFNYADPGFFKQEDLPVKDKDNNTVYLRRVYTDYTLNFDRTGDTYTLSTVKDESGNKVARAGANFFPLDPVGYQPMINQDHNKQYNRNVEDQNAHNYFFGLRYDINFKLGDYIGDLKYKFTGDDDLWVVLDGKTVVIDLGGIHNAATKEVDLWEYLKDADKNAEHTLTVLYMERGAGESNCDMQFTLPNATISQVTTDPLGTLELQKVNSNKEQGLNGARFTLYGDPDCKSEIGSVESARVDNVDGKVIFRSLREGTYYLRETQAPDGYVGSTETWTVEVTKKSDTEVSVTLKDSSENSVEHNQIVNQTKQEFIDSNMEYNKTVSVDNWDKRTYNINITASSKTTSSSVVTTGGVADVVMALDVSGSMARVQTNSDRDASYTKKGRYEPSGLDVNKVYYYSSYHYPLVNIGGEWKYYSSYSGWQTPSSYVDVYTCPSRMTALKEVVNKFIKDTAVSSPTSKIGLAAFNTRVITEKDLSKNVKDAETDLLQTVSKLKADGGTSPSTALNKAYTFFKNVSDKNKYVILFTDGRPTADNLFDKWSDAEQDEAENQAILLKKEGIKIFTIGFALDNDADAKKFLAGDKNDSENYPGIASEGCAFNANNADELAKIFEKIQHTVTEDTAIQNATITDVIDPRFVILDEEGNAITADQLKDGKTVQVNGGTVYLDAKGNQCIKWEGQTIPNKKENEAGDACWSRSIKVKAKDDYIGGNNVPTNVSPDSKISTGYGNAILPQPKVNVKSDLVVNNNETTIFYGDKVPTAEDILKVLFDKAKPQGYVTQLDGKKKLVTYTMGANGQAFNENDFTLTWYEDEACTKPIEVGNMAKVFPEPDSKKYYLKVTYNAGGDTRTVTAINSDTEKYPNKEYGVYTIHIIKGQIQITKKLKEAAKQNGTFTFKIYKNSAEESNLVTTVTATVKTGDTDAKFTMGNDESKAIVGGLARGEYIVKEVSQSGYQLLSAENDSKVTNCKSEKSEDIKFKDIKFTIGTDNDNKNALEAEALKVEGVDYAKYAGPGCVGKVDYTNKETVANVDFVKVDAADHDITINGASFTLYKADESWNEDEKVEDVTSKDGGTFGFEKLLPGNYLLKETKAATGYSLVTEPWKIVIKNNGEVTVTKNDGKTAIVKNSDERYMIKNAKVYSLPESGGPGTYGFTISGVAILATALLLFINNKRREEEAKRS